MKNNEANTTIIKISSELILSNLFNNGVAFLATIKNRSIYPKAIPIEVRAPKKEASPSTKPETTDKYTARNISSNIIIPKINSVSLLPVLLKSTNTLATIALEEIVIIPAIIKISSNGNPIINPYNKPSEKLIKI